VLFDIRYSGRIELAGGSGRLSVARFVGNPDSCGFWGPKLEFSISGRDPRIQSLNVASARRSMLDVEAELSEPHQNSLTALTK
jgi:hypothetical protein